MLRIKSLCLTILATDVFPFVVYLVYVDCLNIFTAAFVACFCHSCSSPLRPYRAVPLAGPEPDTRESEEGLR
jgi:hypothetical protein